MASQLNQFNIYPNPCYNMGMDNYNYNLNIAESAITKVVHNIFEQALINSATDIYLEPDNDNLSIKYRQYGKLSEPIIMPGHLITEVFTQIKALAKIDPSIPVEKTITGDFKIKKINHDVLFQASLLPLAQGEKFIIKILPSTHTPKSLYELGLADHDLFTIQKYLEKKTGIIIIAGPEKSGKTTTAYALLSYLNFPHLSISTLEENIEHDFKYINQAEINLSKGFDFNTGWNALKHQDADIIYLETLSPDISLNDLAALSSGKLIITSITTADSFLTLANFLNRKQNKDLILENLALIIQQKLTAQICPHCRTKHKLTNTDIFRLQKKFDLDDAEQIKAMTFYEGAGCEKCNYTGNLGQIPVYEVLEIDHELAQTIKQHGLNWQTKKILEEKTSIFEDAFAKANEGLINLEELMKLL